MKARILGSIGCPKCESALQVVKHSGIDHLKCPNPDCWINQNGVLFDLLMVDLRVESSYAIDVIEGRK